MEHNYAIIRDLLRRARARWRTLAIFRASTRAALAASVVVALAIGAAVVAAHAPVALALIAATALLAGTAAVLWGLAPLRHVPGDARVARFVEERAAGLDDRLVSAVDAMTTERYASSPAIAEAMFADAARHAGAVDLETVVPAAALRRAGFQAAGAVLLLLALVVVSRDRSRQAFDAATLALFPAHVRLEVTPGNARVKAGTPVTIEATLVGNRAPITARAQFADGDQWRDEPMQGRDGRFTLPAVAANSPFKYRVAAGPATSDTYAISVVRPPHVTRIDVDYTFPAGLGLKPRTDEDSGDIYAPAGSDVRVRVHTDKPIASGRMALGDGHTVPLASEGGALVGSLKIVEDNSYRIALNDRDGLANPGDTEYFIRTLEDRPPEVRILKPASDRAVTRLEEVDVEAQADDDYGIARMDLVYSVRGGAEQVVPFPVPARQTSVTGHRTMYLEDLNVRPGDMISYYVRARDLTRGKRSNEAKSDIFFLEVKPFDQEFSMAQSQAMAGAGGNSSIDDLVTAQKEIVVATWKLDRRGQTAKAKAEQDIRSVSRAESALKSRVEQTSSTFRESAMRDPRRPKRGPQQPSATKALPEEDDMGAAAAAMQKAVGSLDALKTNAALSPEMEALNHLLKAQSDVKKRQIARQQSGAGRADNNRNYDLSTLFDKDLQKNQQTNYETPNSAERREDPNTSVLDKVKELARRQDELVKRQQELAAQRAAISEEELKRQLEKLTRDQLELRQKTEELARQMARNGQQSAAEQQSQQPSGQQPSGQKPSGQQSGQQQSRQQQGGQQQSGQQQGGQQQSGQQQGGQQSGQQNARSQGPGSSGSMRSASEEMNSAAGNLRRQNPQEASAAAGRALERLRELERQLQSSRPDERRRAMGEMQLEARQLADNQRDLASELQKQADADSLRRLAGEQERLADRVRRLHQGLKQASSAGAGSAAANDREQKNTEAAAAEAARELERQHVADRMQQTAEQMRQAADSHDSRQSTGQSAGQPSSQSSSQDARQSAGQPARSRGQESAQQEEMARALDKLADKLAGATGSHDAESQKLSERLTRAQELRDRLNRLTKQVQELSASQGSRQSAGQQPTQTAQRSGGQQGQSSNAQNKAAGQTGQQNRGESGGTAGGNDIARLRDEYQRELQQTRELLDQLRRDDPNFNAQHGAGFTFEGQGMVLSAPGTEAFKQDFARWEDLRKQATQALDNAQLQLSQKLQAKESRDRLVSGADDRAPADYRKQVDAYFKAIASKRKQ